MKKTGIAIFVIGLLLVILQATSSSALSSTLMNRTMSGNYKIAQNATPLVLNFSQFEQTATVAQNGADTLIGTVTNNNAFPVTLQVNISQVVTGAKKDWINKVNNVLVNPTAAIQLSLPANGFSTLTLTCEAPKGNTNSNLTVNFAMSANVRYNGITYTLNETRWQNCVR